MEVLKVAHLSKNYGQGETAVKALDDVSFTIRKGEFVAITGPSGSGKSTLMHLLGGVDRPSGGHIHFGDTDLYSLDEDRLAVFRRRRIGLVYQFYNLIPVLTVAENIQLPLLMDRQPVNQQHYNNIVDALGLKDRLHHLPNQLSGGQQQRVSIGRALIGRPDLVLADEPTGNLDSRNGAEIIDLLRVFNRIGQQTLIIVTHDERIARQADRVIAIEDGRVFRDEGVQ